MCNCNPKLLCWFSVFSLLFYISQITAAVFALGKCRAYTKSKCVICTVRVMLKRFLEAYLIENTTMAYTFASKKYLVTGAQRGIGRAITKAFSEQGSKVYALSFVTGAFGYVNCRNPGQTPKVANVGNWNEIREKLANTETLDG